MQLSLLIQSLIAITADQYTFFCRKSSSIQLLLIDRVLLTNIYCRKDWKLLPSSARKKKKGCSIFLVVLDIIIREVFTSTLLWMLLQSSCFFKGEHWDRAKHMLSKKFFPAKNVVLPIWFQPTWFTHDQHAKNFIYEGCSSDNWNVQWATRVLLGPVRTSRSLLSWHLRMPSRLGFDSGSSRVRLGFKSGSTRIRVNVKGQKLQMSTANGELACPNFRWDRTASPPATD